jgi:hypothetical protein
MIEKGEKGGKGRGKREGEGEGRYIRVESLGDRH